MKIKCPKISIKIFTSFPTPFFKGYFIFQCSYKDPLVWVGILTATNLHIYMYMQGGFNWVHWIRFKSEMETGRAYAEWMHFLAWGMSAMSKRIRRATKQKIR